MVHLKIDIEQDGVDNGALFTGVYINGISMPGILNIDAFFPIKETNGLVPLFTCGCGVFGCGGHYVNAICTDTALILHNSYHRGNQSLESTFEYHLGWSQVKGIAQEIFTYLQKIYERDPQAYVTIGYAGENLLERLPDYRQSSLLEYN